SSWGGTPAQAWLSLEALRQEPPLAAQLAKWDEALAQHRKVLAQPEIAAAYQAELKHWQKEIAPAFNAAMKAYNTHKTGPKPSPAKPEPANPDPMGLPSPSMRPSTPSVIYNTMIAPIATFGIRGALWYQGEANGSGGLEYRALLPRLIGDWRARWGQGDLPFLVVQLPGWDFDPKPTFKHQWPWLREAQALTAKNVANTGLAVTIDLGDPKEVHPKGKLDVALRLILLAEKMAYGAKVVCQGPTFRELRLDGPVARVSFTDVGSGLTLGQAPWRAEGVEPFPTDKLVGFTIAGEDRIWYDAGAQIEGDSVVLSHPAVIQPVAVRYGWANAPRCNLYNKEGLPAAPFRSDDWAPP
ncbi:MAG: sialate O-acetylesterase, partial [Roseimicrobium sp.]